MLFYIARHDVSRGFVFFYFVTCPCSFRTKRHDNLFVCGDDDDDDATPKVAICFKKWLSPMAPTITL